MAENVVVAVDGSETPKVGVEVSPTLRAGRQGAVAIIPIQAVRGEGGGEQGGPGVGRDGDPMYTLTAAGQHMVGIEGEDDSKALAVDMGGGKGQARVFKDISPTLTTSAQGHAVAYSLGAEATAADDAAPPPPEYMMTARLSFIGFPGTATTTSLSLPPDLEYERWKSIARVLQAIESAAQWMIGDWLNFGKRTYGKKYAQAVDEGQAKTWRNYAYVASRIEMSRRRDNLAWSVHAEIASIESDADRTWMLEIAARNGWTTRIARDAVRRFNHRPPRYSPLALASSILDAGGAFCNAVFCAQLGLDKLRHDLPPSALKYDLLADAEDVVRRLREFADQIRE